MKKRGQSSPCGKTIIIAFINYDDMFMSLFYLVDFRIFISSGQLVLSSWRIFFLSLIRVPEYSVDF